MKKGAIFDMDGLLTDTERFYSQSWRETARFFGQAWIEGFDRAVAGTSGEKMLEVIHTHFPYVDARAFMNFCIGNQKRLVREELREMPGAGEIVRFFRERGVKTAVASSSSREAICDNLGRLGMLELFDAVISGEEIRHGKPAPDIFLLAAERIGCAPEDCYVFEDGINGCLAGIAAGCTTVMIPDLFEPTEELRRNCAGIFESLTAAKDAITQGLL